MVSGSMLDEQGWSAAAFDLDRDRGQKNYRKRDDQNSEGEYDVESSLGDEITPRSSLVYRVSLEPVAQSQCRSALCAERDNGH